MVTYYIYEDPNWFDDPVERPDLASIADIYINLLVDHLKYSLRHKRFLFREWDGYWFDRYEWEIESCDAPWFLCVWTGTPKDMLNDNNRISHETLVDSLPEDTESMKKYERILAEIDKYNTEEVLAVEQQVKREEHPGRARTLNIKAAFDAVTKRRAAEIMAEPTKRCCSCCQCQCHAGS